MTWAREHQIPLARYRGAVTLPELFMASFTSSRLDPGWLRTDMGSARAPNDPSTVLPGALVPVLLPDDAPGGQFFRAQDLRDAKL